MVVMILEKVPARARGELSRWMIEPYPGVFVGNVSALVRDRLWERCCKNCKDGGVVQIWTTNNEQGYRMRMHGNTRRSIVEMEGIQLVQIPEVVPRRNEIQTKE
jgi:CRISPR-associated protein Cas2